VHSAALACAKRITAGQMALAHVAARTGLPSSRSVLVEVEHVVDD